MSISSSASGSITPPGIRASARSFFFYVAAHCREVHLVAQGEVVQEVRDQQVLHLAHQRQGFASQPQRVVHARHPLVEILLHCARSEDVAQRLLRMRGHRVRPPPQVLHVAGQEAEHQLLDLPPVLLVVGRRRRLAESARCLPSGLLQGPDITVEHRQELNRVQLLALEADADVQPLAAQGHRLSRLYALPELGVDVRQVAVCHLVLPVADRLADAVHGVAPTPDTMPSATAASMRYRTGKSMPW